jgi:hypothetical protein
MILAQLAERITGEKVWGIYTCIILLYHVRRPGYNKLYITPLSDNINMADLSVIHLSVAVYVETVCGAAGRSRCLLSFVGEIGQPNSLSSHKERSIDY